MLVEDTTVAPGNGVAKEKEDAGFASDFGTKNLEKNATIRFMQFAYGILYDVEVVEVVEVFC